jgi:hypothetical protein
MIGGYIARRAVTGLMLAIFAALGTSGAWALGPISPAGASPTLVIEKPADGSFTNEQTPTIRGTATGLSTVTVKIYRGTDAEGTAEQSPADPLPVEGSWSVTPDPLEEGTYTAVAEQTEVTELAERGESEPVTFTLDTTEPQLTLSPVTSPTNDPTPTLSGAAGAAEGDDPAVTVTIYEGSSVDGEAAAAENVPREGAFWSYTPPHLGDGTYTAQATQRDAAGNVGQSTTRTFTVDTTPPAVTLDPVSSPTSDPTPLLQGSGGEADGPVSATIHEGTTTAGDIVASGSAEVNGGSWSYSSPALPDGTYTAQATQRDAAGNRGESDAATFTVDTRRPALTLAPVESPSNSPTPNLSGAAGTETGDDETVSVSIWEGTSASGEPLVRGSSTVNGGSWSYVSPQLGDGTYTAQATQGDAAGNTAHSATQTFEIDTTAPAVALSSPANGAFLATSKPTFSGAAGSKGGDAGEVTLEIYTGESVGGTPQTFQITRSGGAWTTGSGGPELPDGTYTARVTQVDVAGNVGVSAAHTFTLRTAAPVVTLTPPTSPTSEAAMTFSGSADTSPGDIASVTLKIYPGGSATGEPARVLTAPVSGGAWSVGPIAPLPDGAYTAVAEQKDEAGNVGASAPATFVVDTTAPAVSVSSINSPTNDPSPTIKGSAGTAAGDEPSVSLTIYHGATVGGAEAAKGTFTASGGAWSFTTSPLPDGTYTAQARQSDGAGNTGSSSPVTFTIDTVAPSVSLAPVPSPSNDTTPTLSGSAGAAAGDKTTISVKIYVGSAPEGSVAASSTATRSGGSWSFTALPLADGTYTAQATQADAAGNTGTTTAQTFVIDTAPPQVTLTSPALRSNNTTPSFSGTASDTTQVTVKIYAGGEVKGTPKSQATASVVAGIWSSGPASPALADGSYTAVATQPSSLGNPDGRSEEVHFAVDTAAPTVVLNQLPPSNDRTPKFSGTSSDTTPVTINIYEGETPSGTVVATAKATGGKSGAWESAEATPSLKTGNHTYTATATQPSSIDGNPSGTSAPLTFVVDTTPPTVTLATPPSLSNNRTPSFSGTASDTTPVTVRIYAGPKAEGKPKAETSATVVAGNWTTAPVGSSLADGQYTAVATQPSSLKNPDGKSEPASFTIDATAPSVSISAPTSPTNSPTPTLTGTAAKGDEPTVAVTIYKEGAEAVSSTVAIDGNGNWKYTPSNLADGTYTAQATQTDAAGNVGTSNTVTFVIDTQPPSVTLDAPPLHSNNVTPSFTGTSSDETSSDETRVTVKVYAGSKAEGPVVSEATATVTAGAWTSAPLSPPLKEGKNTYSATATQQDAAGNATTTTAVAFVVDTKAPTITMAAPRSPTNESTPAFQGTASEHTPVTVQIHAGEDATGPIAATATGNGTGGGWTSAPATPALPDGVYTAVARQESAVGNHAGETGEFIFTVDTVAPRPSLDSPADGSSAAGGERAVSGSADTGRDAIPRVTAKLFSGPSIGAGQAPLVSATVGVTAGRWSYTFAGLSPGTYTVRAEQLDQAGNVGVTSAHSFSLIGPSPAAAASRPPTPPAASFTWVPAAPHAGERVSLVSSSEPGSSPLASYAWDVAGNNSFQSAGPVMVTSFATPGNHIVRLRVSDAAGLSSVVAHTIPVSGAAPRLMRPFPIVRIVTTRTARGLRLKLLAVQAPTGSRMSVRCGGRGCPAKSQSRIAAAGRSGLASVTFRRFERILPTGMTLEVRVFNAGQIGKYTRLSIRRGARAKRDDKCLAPDGIKPIACPTR